MFHVASPTEAAILFVNNYPMTTAAELVADGRYPAHHLWGLDTLRASAGFRVDVVEPDDWAAAIAWRGAALRHLGSLPRQIDVVRRARSAWAVYAANEADLRLLCLARRAGLFRLPLVVLFHHVPGPKSRAWVRGVDVALHLSDLVGHALREEMGLPAERVVAVRMGPDLDFRGYAGGAARPAAHGTPAGAVPLVVSAGKTGRDSATLFEALRVVDVPAIMYVRDAGGPLGRSPWTPAASHRVRIVRLAGEDQHPYEDVLADLKCADVVAIPLEPSGRGLAGLTELLDAMALGKPVVMTRNPLVDVDIEEIGCGTWVAPGDVAGWTRALDRLRADPAERVRMGQRGRAAVEEGLNYQAFCDTICEVFSRLWRQRRGSATPRVSTRGHAGSV